MAPRALIVIVRLTGASKWFLIDRINHFLNILQTSSIRANYKSVNLSWTDPPSHQPFIVVSLTTFVTNFASNYKLDSEKIFFLMSRSRDEKKWKASNVTFLFQQLSFQCDQTCQKLTTVGKRAMPKISQKIELDSLDRYWNFYCSKIGWRIMALDQMWMRYLSRMIACCVFECLKFLINQEIETTFIRYK